ncbi:hypothetical protein Tco_0466400 [Tanacetum coccineum]
MGRGTWYYSLGVSSIVDAFVRSEFGVSSWHGSRVDGRSYLLSGAIDGSEANRIISDSNTRSDADLRRLVSFDVFRKARGVERLQELQGADDFIVYYDARSKDLETCLEKGREGDCWYVATIEGSYEGLYDLRGRRSEAKNEFELDLLQSDQGEYDKVFYPSGADTMLCGFRLTNRWLSMKKVIASCGSKYLAYLEVEVEYQGSSGLLLQPELPE